LVLLCHLQHGISRVPSSGNIKCQGSIALNVFSFCTRLKEDQSFGERTSHSSPYFGFL
jgi:hypothetical protein